jgi:hypothetical protein
MPCQPHPFAAKCAELRQPLEASLRKILDTADEIEARTGVRPDVRGLWAKKKLERGQWPGLETLPDWFR